MNIKQKLVVCPLCFPLVVLASDLERTATGFVWPLGKEEYNTGEGWWLSKDPDYFKGEYHLGVDMKSPYDSRVYAIADGEVRAKSPDGWGDENCAAVIEHKTYDGSVFTAIYGHLQCSSLIPEKSRVYAGQVVGKIGRWPYGDHLHFGIHDGSFASMAKSGWGRRSVTHWTDPCEGNTACDNTFVDPIRFIETHYAHNPSTEHQTYCAGNVCWSPPDVTCEQAQEWFRLQNDPVVPYADPVGVVICNDLHRQLQVIAQNPHHEEVVPEEKWWRSWWRAIRNFFGETVSAQSIPDFGVIRTISVSGQYVVVAGNGVNVSHGTGIGYPTKFIESAVPNLPNFITTKVWLTTPWQTEAYTYGQPEKMKMHAQFKNIGDKECSGTIIVHFYLSREYKEDAHADWKRVGTDEIKCENLRPGQTHSEEEGLELWRDIPEPGVWNITAYIDHPKDDHNHGGDHPEKHESDNGSTEAVFEVTADGQVVNIAPPPPQPDLIAHDFAVGSVFQGDPATFVYWIKNQGNANAPETFTALELYVNGSWIPVASPNRVRADHATAGYDHYEAVKTDPISVPPGAYSARVRADDGNRAGESDEGNNVLQGTLTVTARPKPKLVIVKFQDQRGCCTTNTGEYLYPDIWIRNDGPAAPAANVRVLYQVSSNGTGGAYWTMGYGTIEPRELPSGGTDEDYMDGNRWQIPKNSAWKKQWHTVRACVNTEGGEPTCGPGDSVATYARYSKK